LSYLTNTRITKRKLKSNRDDNPSVTGWVSNSGWTGYELFQRIPCSPGIRTHPEWNIQKQNSMNNGYIHKCGWMGNVLGSTNMNAHNFLNKGLKLIFLCL